MKEIAWAGMGSSATGYGYSNTMLIQALRKAGIAVRTPDSPRYGKCDVGIVYAAANQDMVSMTEAPYRIFYTMFEADLWPENWVAMCNCANRVWVPSQFCKEGLEASGCMSPIDVVPLGIDPGAYSPATYRGGEGFLIGYAGAAQYRKGYDLVKAAFLAEFGPDEDARLLLRSTCVGAADGISDKRISVYGGTWSIDDMRYFYQNLDLFAFPSRGEGFGLTPLEAMACGCCVAVTNGSGCKDYLDSDTLRIGVERLVDCPDYHGTEGRLIQPSIDSLRYCMRWAYENREEAQAMGAEAAQRVARDWTYAQSAERMVDILGFIDPSERIVLEPYDAVVWKGDPRKVKNAAGSFTRGEPVELTPEKAAMLDYADGRFCRERRYRRKAGGGRLC